ncbi:ActR/PrrA/RegA family redox response regulator transcription factor [Sphingosinicella microcystinivorans]|uniref:DNA-binding response regulator n=1 Tax=Sphingosinicella microcystinivorans TaxID=335406 RepID=A0AAD1FZR2_SPHMI|nr:ActR/PrrA/RegA family redox response regulator transcription factor [Sphingosinicella microcystinivorans]RKS85588.1 two-component system response regulator RegA [Sphingosinicella microcystinivorans]BBE33117.1 DNA-binding response regulator [Sphingosinicella microcystinivorans]
MTTETESGAPHTADRTLLLVDDDNAFRQRLGLTLERRGYTVAAVASVAEARGIAAELKPAYAVLDMRLGDGNGLDLVGELRALRPGIRIVMLTGYGNLATAVAAVKAGAVDYLPKPADPDAILNALLAPGEAKPAPPEEPMSADRVKWEHIQRVYELCDRNVSETARRLKMHRRTLQRILSKRSPR